MSPTISSGLVLLAAALSVTNVEAASAQKALTVTKVSTARQLAAAMDAELAHIHITDHLDLTDFPPAQGDGGNDFFEVFSPGVHLESMTVRCLPFCNVPLQCTVQQCVAIRLIMPTVCTLLSSMRLLLAHDVHRVTHSANMPAR
jgi:hypothetical protein